MRKFIYILLLSFCTGLFSQQIPVISQYMYQGLLVNPAIAGSRNDLIISFTHRNQYLGNTNTPITNILSAHSPIRNESLSIGMQVYQQTFNGLGNLGLAGFGAYRFKVSKAGKLSLGLKVGGLSSSFNWSDIETIQSGDPNFQNINQSWSPMLGFGTYFNSNKFYAGLAVPEMVDNISEINLDFTNWNTTLITGYIFDLNEKISVLPNFLIRSVINQKPQTDLTLLVRIDKKLDIGAIVRSGGKILGASLDITLKKQLHLGYSFDTGIGNSKVIDTFGNHELNLSYGFKKVVKTYNTRFF